VCLRLGAWEDIEDIGDTAINARNSINAIKANVSLKLFVIAIRNTAT
jgi:hypothetical protein